jgi:hypothetical protein
VARQALLADLIFLNIYRHTCQQNICLKLEALRKFFNLPLTEQPDTSQRGYNTEVCEGGDRGGMGRTLKHLNTCGFKAGSSPFERHGSLQQQQQPKASANA